jgi:hypothetical protein
MSGTPQPAVFGVGLDLLVGYIQTTTAVTTPMAVGDVKTGALYSQTVANSAVALAPFLRVQVRA